MNASETERALQIVLEMADRASAVVLDVYSTKFAVDYKSEADPVTAADREANAILCEGLAKHFPGVPIVAEESDPTAYAKWHDASATRRVRGVSAASTNSGVPILTSTPNHPSSAAIRVRVRIISFVPA